MQIAYSQAFTVNIVAGYLLGLLGALLALVAAVWWVQAQEWLDSGPPPPVFGALTAAAFTLFTIGIVWQLVGYLRLEYAVGW
jgi:hypothetical protein